MVVLSGDEHMASLLHGANNNYGKMTLFNCAALDASPSCKSTGFSYKPSLKYDQFCYFQVTKDHKKTCLTGTGFRMDEPLFETTVCSNEGEVFDEEVDLQYELGFHYACPVKPKLVAQSIFYGYCFFFGVFMLYSLARNCCSSLE